MPGTAVTQEDCLGNITVSDLDAKKFARFSPLLVETKLIAKETQGVYCSEW